MVCTDVLWPGTEVASGSDTLIFISTTLLFVLDIWDSSLRAQPCLDHVKCRHDMELHACNATRCSGGGTTLKGWNRDFHVQSVKYNNITVQLVTFQSTDHCCYCSPEKSQELISECCWQSSERGNNLTLLL